MNFKPLGRNVLIKRIPPRVVTPGGIDIPISAQTTNEMEIIAIGPESTIPQDAVGSIAYLSRSTFAETVSIDGTDYGVLEDKFILGIFWKQTPAKARGAEA